MKYLKTVTLAAVGISLVAIGTHLAQANNADEPRYKAVALCREAYEHDLVKGFDGRMVAMGYSLEKRAYTLDMCFAYLSGRLDGINEVRRFLGDIE